MTLAKLGWRMIQSPTSLWSKVIRGKYCMGRLARDMFEPRARSSRLWKGVIVNEAKKLT